MLNKLFKIKRIKRKAHSCYNLFRNLFEKLKYIIFLTYKVLNN